MKIKNILMAAVLATTILHAQAIVRDMESGNTVGFSYHEIRPGTNSIALPPFVEGGAEIGGKKTLALFLPAACEGDEVFVGSMKAIARKVRGTQHWFDGSKCVDDAPLPRKGETILYVRHVPQSSNLTISGEVELEVRAHEKPIHSSPVSDKIKPIEHPELYLADYLSYSTVCISNNMSMGTGFFFVFQSKGKIIPAIVTNKHVPDGARETTLTFTEKKDNRPTMRQIRYFTNYLDGNVWIGHPDPSVDLTILPLLPIMKTIKDSIGKDIFYMPYTTNLVPDEKQYASLTQLDEVAMIGYPDGIWDTANNQPIFRRGTLATRPNKNYKGSRMFLVDVAIYGGSSGSPILLVSEGLHYDRGFPGHIATRPRLNLLGVASKTSLHKEFGMIMGMGPQRQLCVQSNMITEIRVPNNLCHAIHASRLVEMETYLGTYFERRTH